MKSSIIDVLVSIIVSYARQHGGESKLLESA